MDGIHQRLSGPSCTLTARRDCSYHSRDAFNTAASGNVKIIFDVTGPFKITSRLPILAGANITIEGNGAMLDGDGTADGGADGARVEIGGHDVIVENLRLRNGYDNLRAQGDGCGEMLRVRE